MNDEASNFRRHPDLFIGLDACAYLHLPADDSGLRTLETYRSKDWLIGHQHGRELVYWREDLDACVLRIVGRAGHPGGKRQSGPRLKTA